MTTREHVERFRHGHAHWATKAEIKRAGYFKQTDTSVHIGYAYGKPLRYNLEAGGIINAGPRSGKFTGIIGYNACTGLSRNTQVFFGPKAEEAMVGWDQTAENRHCYYFAPIKRFFLPQHKINPLGHVTIDSPTIIGDMDRFIADSLPESGGGNAKFFELTAQRLGKALGLAITERDGEFTFATFYQAINLIAQNNREWSDFAWAMNNSRFEEVRAVEAEIANGQKTASNAYQSVLAELQNAFRGLSDPYLMAAVSPPFDVTLEEICEKGGMNLYLLPPPEFIKSWSPIIRTIFSSLKTIKSRNINWPKQDWWIDEAPLLAPFPIASELLNFGAGEGIRVFFATQSFGQMDQIVDKGSINLPAGSGLQIYFGIRELETAERISKSCGVAPVYYHDDLKRAEAALEKQNSLSKIFGGADPMQAGIEYAHHSRASQHVSQQEAPLIRPEEVMHLPHGKAIIFLDGLSGPVLADLPPYFANRPMAGKYLANPAHPPMDKVRVKRLIGHGWRNVITEPVPPECAHLPQYADAPYSYVER